MLTLVKYRGRDDSYFNTSEKYCLYMLILEQAPSVVTDLYTLLVPRSHGFVRRIEISLEVSYAFLSLCPFGYTFLSMRTVDSPGGAFRISFHVSRRCA